MEFKLGDAFGCDPTPTQQYHQGDMRTLVWFIFLKKSSCLLIAITQCRVDWEIRSDLIILFQVDDCEFVLVEHKDFCSIMSTLSEHIEKDRDGLTGEVRTDYIG